MITGNIKDAEKYYSVNPSFKAAFEFLKTLTEESDEGAFEGEGFKGFISSPETSDVAADGSEKVFEAHRDWLDIHYTIDGSEGIGYSFVGYLEPITEYNADDDYQLLKGEVNKMILKKGDFCIVFPEDAHIPAMSGTDASLKKAVVKIRL